MNTEDVMAKTLRITEDLTRQICAAIRKGAYPHVAAEAFGVPKAKFDEWLHRGANPRARKTYRGFYLDVRQAIAHARFLAEAQVLKEKPLDWLKSGPGKETCTEIGWSNPAPANKSQAGNTLNVLSHPELQDLFSALLQILTPFPEARAEVARVLSGELEESASSAIPGETEVS